MSQVEDAIPQCVFTRMDCLEKKYPTIFTLNQKLDMSYDFCSNNSHQKDFGNGQFFIHIEDLIGSENIQKLVEYKKVKSIWNLVRTIDTPILYDKDNDIEYEGKLSFKKNKVDFIEYDLDMPLTPVMSSTVMARGVKNDELYVRFHSSPNNTYKYGFGSNDEALAAFNEMTESSPGRWVWKNLRGHSKGEQTGIKNVPEKYGRVYGTGKPITKSRATGKPTAEGIKGRTGGRMTIGGLGSEGDKAHPYMKLSQSIKGLETIPHMEKLAKEMRKFKMDVKADDPTSGEPFTVDELEKYQKKIYEEKEARKGIHEEVKQMIEEKTRKGIHEEVKKKIAKLKPKKKPKKKEVSEGESQRERQFEEQVSSRTETPPEARVRRAGGDFDESKGRWVTIKGKHVFIEKGQKLVFGEGGKYKKVSGKVESKAEEIKKKIKEKGIKKEELPETTKQKKERETKEKESTKQEKAGEKERLRRRREIDRMAKAVKKDKPTPEREKGIQAIIERKGYDRERAEKEYDRKHPKKPDKREVERKEAKRIKTESKITKKKIVLDKKITKLRELNKGKSGWETLNQYLELATRIVQEIESDEGFVGLPIAQHIDKIRKDKNITEERKRKLIQQIQDLHADIKALKPTDYIETDFELLTEIMELESELETYDYYVDDHLDEFLDFIENDFDPSKPGRWITTKTGKRVYIEDIQYYTEEELNPNYDILINPSLKVDKRINLKENGYKLDAINRTLNSLPVNLIKMINEVRVYKKITQDPSMRSSKGKVPEVYKKVGWKRTYDKIEGVYIIEDNNAILTPNAYWGTTRHEIGHSVWYSLKEKDRIKFKEIHKEQKPLMLKIARKLKSEAKKYDKDSLDYLIRKERAEGIQYEANDVEEYFAEGFNRYYEAKAPIYSWQERSYQKQPSSEVAYFFRTRMKKYEKEEESFEVITNII